MHYDKFDDNKYMFSVPDGFFVHENSSDDITIDKNWKNPADSKSRKGKRSKSDKSVHKGHRIRVRDRFIEYGFEGFTKYQILEFILFHSIPKGDTNELAHHLIDRFGSIEGVLKAEFNELMEVKGVGKVTAAMLVIHRELNKFLNTNDCKGEYLPNAVAVGEFCCRYFKSHIVEEAILLFINGRRKLEAVERISRGTETKTALSPRNVMKYALRHSDCHIILSHNHPNGNPAPSNNDILATNQLVSAMKQFDIEIMDHIICGGDRYISLFEKGYIEE